MNTPTVATSAGDPAGPATPPPALHGIYPRGLADGEQELVNSRRDHWKGSGGADSPVIAGLALSGGGIRSATFCLGFLQALAKRKLLERFDFLSTVSGGGYIGSFVGAWINNVRDGKTVQNELPKSASKPVRFLRDNGRYLAPNGAGDALAAMASHLRSWFTVWLVLGLVGFGGLLLVEAAKMGRGYRDWRNSSAVNLSEKTADCIAAAASGQAEGRRELTAGTRGGGGEGAATEGGTATVAANGPGSVSITKTETASAAKSPTVRVDATLAAQHGASVWKTALCYVHTSPLFEVAAWLLLLLVLPPMVAYWYAGRSFGLVFIWILLAAVGAWLGWACIDGSVEPWSFARKVALWWSYGLTVALAGYASTEAKYPEMPRNRLNDWLATALELTGAVAALALVDTIGLSLTTQGVWSAAILPVLAAVAQSLLPRLATGSKKETPGWVTTLALPLGAVVVALFAFGVLSSLAHRAGEWIAVEVTPTVAGWTLVGTFAAFAAIAIYHFRPWKWLWAAALGAGAAWSVWCVRNWGGEAGEPVLAVVAIAAVFLTLGAWVGFSFGFVNLSSHHRLYSARLTRAYLGASNPLRTGASTEGASDIPTGRDRRDVTSAMPGDQISMVHYRPHAFGGPLHLINVTVNETIDGISQIEQNDRKGFSLAVGPLGLSARTMDHALFEPRLPDCGKKRDTGKALLQPAKAEGFHTLAAEDGRAVEVEMPALGSWVGISGAAFTTGLGAGTSRAKSFLLGFFNVRLGYWWDSGLAPEARAARAKRGAAAAGDAGSTLYPAQAGLFDEWTARFRGAARRHWYLSDGGHFENCAVYELMRRRLPLIVCCDCGADPDYEFEDVGNLVRKARIDFGAEIVFWGASQLDAELESDWKTKYPGLNNAVGTLAELEAVKKGPAKGFSPKNVALAWITYPAEENASAVRSLLVLVKPTLSNDTPEDLQNYDSTESAFPQQSTLDQFFDEAQWESYRKLGAFIGEKLFAADAGGKSVEWDRLVEIAKKHRPAAAGGQLVPV